MTLEEKSAIGIEQLRADRDRLLSVLDKIRAETENITPKCQIRTGKTSIDTEMMIPQEKVLQIIDKYKAESEEKK